jgi:hypothetical protein
MIVMFDSVTLDAIPSDAQAVAGYVDGYATWPRLKKLWPRAHRLSITLTDTLDADCIDVENGAATIADAAVWAVRRASPTCRPVVYISISRVGGLLFALREVGIARQNVRIWTAHYTGRPHICTRECCTGAPPVGFEADGTQWTENALGRNLDESLLLHSFFTAPVPKTTTVKVKARAAVKKVKSTHPKTVGATAGGGLGVAIAACLHAFGIVHLTPAENSAIAALVASVAALAANQR